MRARRARGLQPRRQAVDRAGQCRRRTSGQRHRALPDRRAVGMLAGRNAARTRAGPQSRIGATTRPDLPARPRDDPRRRTRTLVEYTRVALCRCGASQNKPFCDGSHDKSGFDDPVLRQRAVVDQCRPNRRSARDAKPNGPLMIEGKLEFRTADGSSFVIEKSGCAAAAARATSRSATARTRRTGSSARPRARCAALRVPQVRGVGSLRRFACLQRRCRSHPSVETQWVTPNSS